MADEAEPARIALAEMDHVLAQRPHKDDDTLTEVAKNLCEYRDRMIGRHRQQPLGPVERDRLERLNAVIVGTLGLHFPLASVPWDEFAKARGWLADLLEGVPAA